MINLEGLLSSPGVLALQCRLLVGLVSGRPCAPQDQAVVQQASSRSCEEDRQGNSQTAAPAHTRAYISGLCSHLVMDFLRASMS